VIDDLPLIGDQTNIDAATTEIQANMQHMNRASFRLVLDDKPELATEGGPPSSHSLAAASFSTIGWFRLLVSASSRSETS
jgi:hypothetical protein